MIIENFVVPTSGCNAISSGGTCYRYFSSDYINWEDARQQCIIKGYNLATITSSTDNILMYNTGDSGDYCWIGLNDIDNEGTFVWADGNDSTFREWDTNQPNDFGSNEDCGHTVGSQYWNDNTCTKVADCYFCSSIGE